MGGFMCIRLFILLFGLVAATVSTDAEAVCGKQCKEAKNFCKKWEKDHPGEECGRVRGAICNPPGSGGTWKKIDQVNAFWAACHLVKGEEDHASAQKRCKQYETNIGGNCEVHSPRCNAGWVKLADYGKFQSCRKLEPSGSLLYDGYKAWMRKWEGKADTKMAPALADFVQKHYPRIDVSKVRFGYVSSTPSSTCITDCNHIYCDDKSIEDSVKAGVIPQDDADLVFHELTHVEQCAELGGREAYAKFWFKNVPVGFFKAIDGNPNDDFQDELHDKMPMEKDAEKKGEQVAKKYGLGWWNQKHYCRIYKSDRKTEVWQSREMHNRLDCSPNANNAIWSGIKQALVDAAAKHGSDTYWVAHGVPEHGEPTAIGDNKAGYWLHSQEMKAPPPRRAMKP
jgi:hypothetical protein